MFKKFALIAAATTSTLVAIPAAAQAQSYGRYDQRYQQTYRGEAYRSGRYQRGDTYYGNRGYNNAYGQNDGYYGRNNAYYGRNQRCGSGTTGTIIGGVAGALLGREVTRSNNRWGGGNSGTTGAIVGGALGALAGRAVAKSNC